MYGYAERDRSKTYQNHVGRMTECVKIDELFDLCWKSKKSGVHNIRQEPSQGLHVIARFGWRSGSHPFVLGCFDKIVDLGIDNLEYTLFGCFLITPELLGCTKSD